MIMFAVVFFIFLILIQIPVIRQMTFAAVFMAVIAILIALGFSYNNAKNERENREGFRR